MTSADMAGALINENKICKHCYNIQLYFEKLVAGHTVEIHDLSR